MCSRLSQIGQSGSLIDGEIGRQNIGPQAKRAVAARRE
jgi:hypothetical protein